MWGSRRVSAAPIKTSLRAPTVNLQLKAASSSWQTTYLRVRDAMHIQKKHLGHADADRRVKRKSHVVSRRVCFEREECVLNARARKRRRQNYDLNRVDPFSLITKLTHRVKK